MRVENPAQAAVVPRSLAKDPPKRDESFLDFVRSMACCVCCAPAPSDPHHYGRHGMGQKADDRTCVPLCRKDHDDFHAHGFFKRVGLDSKEETRMFLLDRQVAILIAWADELGTRLARARGRALPSRKADGQ